MVRSNMLEAHKASSQSGVHHNTDRLMLYMCPKVMLTISTNNADNNKMRSDPGYDLGSTISPRSKSSSIPSLVVGSSNGRILKLRRLTWKLSPDWMKTDISAPMRLAH